MTPDQAQVPFLAFKSFSQVFPGFIVFDFKDEPDFEIGAQPFSASGLERSQSILFDHHHVDAVSQGMGSIYKIPGTAVA